MNRKNQSTNYFRTVPIFLAFLCMGFGDVVGPLVSLVKESFDVNNFQAQLMTFSGFIMFGILSIPIGLLQDKRGKKFIMNLGLIIALIGLVIPIFNGMYGSAIEISTNGQGKFYILLFSILLLGAGATTLQVVGNPIMRDVSPEGKYSSNLSFAQSVKAIGSSLGFLLPPVAVHFFNLDWTILFPIYSVLILINLILFNVTGLEEKVKDQEKAATLKSCFSLLANPYVLMMVLAIFLYVGAEVSMSSGVPILMKESFGIAKFGLWVSWALFFLPILIGRFTGGLILRVLAPKKFLVITVIISLVGLVMLFSNIEILTFTGIVLTGLGFANIFPLIFSITVDKMPERSNELSGLMVTAIVGGAILPPIMGFVGDKTSILIGFVVPLLAIIYIFIVAIKTKEIIMKQAAIGVDIGGTNTVLGLVDQSGEVIARHSIPTKTQADYKLYMNQLSEAIHELIDESAIQTEVMGIGVGAPNGNYYNGTIEFAPNLNFKGVVPVVDFLKEQFDFQVIVLTNDANAAAIGEMIYGGAKEMKDFIMITLGTGVGSGIVVNGEMVYGHDGFAGEIGHTIVDPNGRDCGCGRKGCLETYTSAPGIKRTVFELLSAMIEPSVLRGVSFEDLSAKMIDEAARNGDIIAKEAFDYTGEVLGLNLANAVAHTSPEAIFLFGGLAQAGDLIFEPVKFYLEENILNIYKNKVKILPSKLPPGDAAVLGSSALVWKELG